MTQAFSSSVLFPTLVEQKVFLLVYGKSLEKQGYVEATRRQKLKQCFKAQYLTSILIFASNS